MFNFIVTPSTDGVNSISARIIDGDVTGVFCFFNTDSGLDTCGGILVAGEAVRTNFTQHYSGKINHPFDTDSNRI
jgi:hypothetical protein